MHYFCIFILAVIDNTTKSYKNNFKMALYIENNSVVAFVSKFAYAHKLQISRKDTPPRIFAVF